MSNWREDPELVRQDDDDLTQDLELDPMFDQLFSAVEQLFVGEGGGFVKGTWRAVIRGMIWQAKKRAAVDPVGTRTFIVEALNLICACLRVEPRELFPDLKPKEPAVA